jgi:hypothetical protein
MPKNNNAETMPEKDTSLNTEQPNTAKRDVYGGGFARRMFNEACTRGLEDSRECVAPLHPADIEDR